MGQTGSFLRRLLSLCVVLLPLGGASPQTTDLGKGELLPQLDALAQTADNAADRPRYITALMTLVGGDSLHKPFYSTLSKRFALDEERVRSRKQALVPETSIAMAFNQLAQILGSPARIDGDTVHRLRSALSPHAPHLITANVSPSSCNPGEAIFLLYLLAANNGTLDGGQATVPPGYDSPVVQSRVSPVDSTKAIPFLMSRFASTHSQVEIMGVAERILSLLNL